MKYPIPSNFHHPFVDTCMNSWFPVLFNGISSVTTITYFDTKRLSIWPMGAKSVWLLCPFNMYPSFFELSLAFWNKMFQTHLVLPLLPSPLDSALSPRTFIPFCLKKKKKCYLEPRAGCPLEPTVFAHCF